LSCVAQTGRFAVTAVIVVLAIQTMVFVQGALGAGSEPTLNLALNPNWVAPGESVNVSVQYLGSDRSPIGNASLEFFINGTAIPEMAGVRTNSNGEFHGNFTAPRSFGTFEIEVRATSSSAPQATIEPLTVSDMPAPRWSDILAGGDILVPIAILIGVAAAAGIAGFWFVRRADKGSPRVGR
jgi:hypothetical protein